MPRDSVEDQTAAKPAWAKALVPVLLLGCAGLLVRSFVSGYNEVEASIADASGPLLLAGLAVSAVAMIGLALLWAASLHAFGVHRRMQDVITWYFAGELGKYLPGGVWTVVGRGELAARDGVERTSAYVTVGISLLATVAAGACAAATLSVSVGDDLPWVPWCAPAVAGAALLALHPRCLGVVAAAARSVSRGRIDLRPVPWTTMLGLAALALPTWLLVGASAWLVAESFDLGGSPSQIMFASIAAWVAGLIAVPVPAGAGVRELVFVQASGLAPAPAVLLATAARLSYVVVDGVGGGIALRRLRRRGDGDVDASSA